MHQNLISAIIVKMKETKEEAKANLKKIDVLWDKMPLFLNLSKIAFYGKY